MGWPKRNREDYEDERRSGFTDRLLKTGVHPDAQEHLGRIRERNSEVRDLWLGDVDPMDIEEGSTMQEIDGFTYIDSDHMKLQTKLWRQGYR